MSDAKTFSLYVSLGPSGLWTATSDELPGLIVAERSLDALFGSVASMGRELYALMEEDRISGRQTEAGKRQMAAFAPFFATP